MLTIRLSRVGTTKRPCYRVVVIESSKPRHGRFVELLGHYNPRNAPEVLEVDHERVSYWTSKGAQLSDTVRTLLARHPAPPSEPEPEPESAEAETENAVPAAVEDSAEAGGDETQAVT